MIVVCCRSDGRLTHYEQVDIQIKRFEQDLFGISVYAISDSISFLEEEYPNFLPLFGHKIIEIGGPGTADFDESLLAFVSDFTIYRASKRVQEVFPDLSWLEGKLSEGFGRYRRNFPQYTIPEVISCVSGFNQSIITTNDQLVISLDKYLGAEDDFYKLLHPPVPEYQRRVMHPEKIPSDVLYGWMVAEFPYISEKDNLLSQMIYKGRTMYGIKQLLPEINDTLLWGFTADQLQFCIDNEKGMWEYLVENKLLFETEKFKVIQYANPAPFTKDFSQESPGRAALWLGYRIIESLVKYNREMMLQELMEESNYQRLLNLSKYNP